MSHYTQATEDLCQWFGCKHPLFLAGMNQAAGAELAAAVSNAGGVGVIGGLNMTPKFLQAEINRLKACLTSQELPWGVDLALPKVGDGARKTNYDYTHGHLEELIEVICDSGAKIFVSAVGVPPVSVVQRLHRSNVMVMNMVGAPKHVRKALAVGCDMICAQGGEGGGHTGQISTLILLPAVLDAATGHVSPLTKKQVLVLGAGGIYDGRSMAAALVMGCAGVWVGTRFICAKEAGATPDHQKQVISAGFQDTTKTLVLTGRPLRLKKTPYIMEWEGERKEEQQRLLARGVVPFVSDMKAREKQGKSPYAPEMRFWLMGQVAGAVKKVMPARDIVEEMARECTESLKKINRARL